MTPELLRAELERQGLDASRIIRPRQRVAPPLRKGSNLPIGAAWVHHEKPNSRAARRRLRQMAQGQIPAGQERCVSCGEWVHGTLGGQRTEGKFSCDGCRAAAALVRP